MGKGENDDFDDVSYEKSPQNGVTIRAASFPFLVRRSLRDFDANGPLVEPCAFSSVFFLTYQWYLEPGELLSMYTDRYRLIYMSDKEQEQNKKLQICQAVSYWINNHGYDFKSNQDVRMQLLEFQDDVQSDIGNVGAQLLDIGIWNVTRQSMKLKLDLSSQRTLSFTELSPRDIAEQITYLDWKASSKISFVEWRDYAKTSKANLSPNLRNLIGTFNNTSKWIAAMVLQKTTPEARSKQMKKFVLVCRHLKTLGNYNGLMAVMGGLSHSVLERLNKTKELLSNEDKLFMKEVLNLLSSDGNYSQYRSEIAQFDGFCVPIIEEHLSFCNTGVIMKDIISLDTAVPDFLNENGRRLCHFKKVYQLAKLLKNFKCIGTTKPPILPKADLVNILRVSLQPRFTEEELYEMSLEREPRCQTPTTCTLPRGIKSKPMFAEWAAGIDITPDREIVVRYVERMVDAVFKVYDTDKDGSINQEEFRLIATNFPFIDDFTLIDTNCDESISKEEMRNYFMNVNSHVMTRDFVHSFQETTIITPVLCVYCTGYLWGLGKSAYKCKDKASKSKTIRKRMKFLEQSFGGSTDSQIYPAIGASTLKTLNSIDNEHFLKLQEQMKKLEMEKSVLEDENMDLRTKLHAARTDISKLKSEVSDLQNHSVYFSLKRMEMLNMQVQTDV
eukprot:gene17574-19326_t